MRLRRGFTLVELLVVIAIIGMLVALLLPAVQAAREAAHVGQCKNNLKQIGLALHSYHAGYNQFPPGYTSGATEINGEGLGPGWGWAAYLLPYLEQGNLHKQIDFKKPIEDDDHFEQRIAQLPVFLCPSDAPPNEPVAVAGEDGTTIATLGFSNYVAMSGTHEVTGFPDTNNGPFYRNSKIRIANITDGTSNTIFAIERASHKSPRTTWVGAVTGAINPPLNSALEEEGPGTFVLTNTGEAADGRVPNNSLDHVEDATSRHTSGACCTLLGDGSVRLIQNTIDPVVWEALGTRGGEEVIGEY